MEPKKKKSKVKWIVIAVLAVIIIGIAASGGDSDEPKKTGEVTTEKSKSDGDVAGTGGDDAQEATTEAPNNIFHVGDVVETSTLKITYYSAEEYKTDNEFMQPKEGNIYYRMEFEFENIGDSDETISSMLCWNCYADGYVMDMAYIGDDEIDATLSPGKKVRGAVYYEVPADSKEIE
ncbi:MAG: DUF4352 domain-containing protein, partial [Wujia sp.]